VVCTVPSSIFSAAILALLLLEEVEARAFFHHGPNWHNLTNWHKLTEAFIFQAIFYSAFLGIKYLWKNRKSTGSNSI
jgi:hypothetical protein